MKIYSTNKNFFEKWPLHVRYLWYLICGIIIGLMIGVNANAQIIDVTRRENGFTEVYGENLRRISSGFIGDKSSDWNFSDCIIVTRRKDGFTEVYDESLRRISSGFIGNESFTSLRVNRCNIIIRRSDNWTEIYNKSLRKTDSGFR